MLIDYNNFQFKLFLARRWSINDNMSTFQKYFRQQKLPNFLFFSSNLELEWFIVLNVQAFGNDM